MAKQIFGSDVELPSGRGSNYPRISGDTANRHAEARGIQAFIGGDTGIRFSDGEVRQACSHYACGNPTTGTGCAGKIETHNVNSVTGYKVDHGGVIGRQFVSDLWILEGGK